VKAAVELAEPLCIDVEWQLGAVAVVDNRLVMHGRRHFEGTRKLYAAFGVEASAGASAS